MIIYARKRPCAHSSRTAVGLEDLDELRHLREAARLDLGPDRLAVERDLEGAAVDQLAGHDVAAEERAEDKQLVLRHEVLRALRQHALSDEGDGEAAEEHHLEHLGQGHLGRARVEDVSGELQLRELPAEYPRVVLERLPVASAHAVLDVEDVAPA